MAKNGVATKNEILVRYCRDLQALDAEHDAQVAQLAAERLKRIAAVPPGRPLIEAAEAARSAAATELSADRERAAAARDSATAAAAEKRRGSFATNEQAWQKAERAAERERDDQRTEENRKHEDALEKIARTLPLSQQAIPRAEEVARHTAALARIQADFDVAWDRSRQDFQEANESAQQAELHASELAGDAHAEAVRVAELHYVRTLESADSKLHEALLACPQTRATEEEMERRGRETRERWQEKRVSLHDRFKKDYDSAPSLRASKARPASNRRRA